LLHGQKSVENPSMCLKKLLTSAPVLAYSRFDERGFTTATNASYSGLGAVLSQLQEHSTIHLRAYCLPVSLDQDERRFMRSQS